MNKFLNQLNEALGAEDSFDDFCQECPAQTVCKQQKRGDPKGPDNQDQKGRFCSVVRDLYGKPSGWAAIAQPQYKVYQDGILIYESNRLDHAFSKYDAIVVTYGGSKCIRDLGQKTYSGHRFYRLTRRNNWVAEPLWKGGPRPKRKAITWTDWGGN